jgi:flavin-dependent dehydrogenase
MLDVIVIGGGPGGSTAATLLARRGFSVTLLERERFPRFQIGESLLPYNNDLFERLGVAGQLDHALAQGTFFPKYGAEFVTGDGTISNIFRFDRNLSDERYHRSFQVKRADFDQLLLRNAAASGVDVREETPVASVDVSDRDRAVVTTASGERLEARFVVDASGHGSVLGNRVGGKESVEELKKVAIFGHYTNVQLREGDDAGNTVIVVLRNGWFWMIPLTKELTSIGLVVDRDHLTNCGLTPDQLLERTIAATPFVAGRMTSSERTTQVYVRRDFSFGMRNVAGENYALVGDAAGFVDPIFSTGVFIAMKTGDVAAAAIEQRLRRNSMRALRQYERSVHKALGKYFRFISNFYRREFLEVFMQPHERFGLMKEIVGVLAGNVFTRKGNRLKLALFFALVRMQRRYGFIAPPIQWEQQPAAATM